MEPICRCCLKIKTNLKEISIELVEMFQDCTGIERFGLKDGFSQFCCKFCWTKLEFVYKFRKDCRKADDIFKNSQNSVENHETNSFSKTELIIKTENDIENQIFMENQSSMENQIFTKNLQHTASNFKKHKQQIYYCKQCGYKFKRMQYLKSHLKLKHLEVKEFSCRLCWLGFSIKKNFENHLRQKHFNKNRTAFITKQEIEKVLIRNNPIQIKILNKKTETNVKKKKNCILELFCKLCNNRFKSKIILKQHFYTVHLKNNLTRYKYKMHLLKVLKKLEGNSKQSVLNSENFTKNYKCEICDMNFTINWNLLKHTKRNHPEYYDQYMQIHCNICYQKFSKKSLVTHMKKQHPDEYTIQNQVYCDVCHKKYPKQSMKSHEKTHTVREKNIQCTECGRTFYSTSTYDYHKKTHSSLKAFKCTHCPKEFYTKYQLNAHSLKHSVIGRPKRFKCNYCGKGCFNTSELNIHFRTHTNDRPFKCSFCNKGFLTQSHLNNHLVTHTGEKNYKCKEDGCKKFYSSVSSLKKHYYAIHFPEDEKEFQCDLCAKKFGQRTFLNQHRKAHGKMTRIKKTL